MERLKNILLVAQLVALVGAAFVVHQQRIDLEALVGTSLNSMDIAGVAIDRMISCQERMTRSSRVASAVARVGAIPYRNPGANCYDHSKALQKELAALGVESSIFVNETRGHAWVAIWVDAITGDFIPPSHTYGAVLEVRDRDLNVICSR